jgi:hypothetical protein
MYRENFNLIESGIRSLFFLGRFFLIKQKIQPSLVFLTILLTKIQAVHQIFG